MVFGKVAAGQREQVAKGVDRFGVNIRGLERGDILGKGQIHYNRASSAVLEEFKDRLVVVKIGSERALAQIGHISTFTDRDWIENVAGIEVKYLTGSKAGETERVGPKQILEFPSFSKVFRSLERDEEDASALLVVVRGAMRVFGSSGAARITRTQGSEETFKDELRSIGATTSQRAKKTET